jgi:hypothetical protein
MTIDLKQFMNTTFSGGSNATARRPVPVGEYKAVIDDVELETFPGKKDPSKTYLRCTVSYNILDEGVKKALDRKADQKVVAVDGWLVDLTDAGDIDFGPDRNTNLGKLREATGCNKPGDEWSFPGFKGKVVKVKIGHEMYEGEPRTRVTGLAQFQ